MQPRGARRRAVFLDRDGILNALVVREGMAASPRRAADFHLMPGAGDAVRRLRSYGLLAFVVTNQPDVARGLLPRAELDAMTAILRSNIAVDEVAVCLHDDGDACPCRKPAPGLLTALAQRWNVDLPTSFAVGDSWKDVEAGRRAGCRTILIGETTARGAARADFAVATLAEAADVIGRALGPERK